MGVFCYVQLLCTSSSLLQQQQWALVNASSSSSSSPLHTSCGCTHSLVASRLHLHNKQQLLRRRSRSSSSSRMMRVCHSRELGLGLIAMAEEEEEEEDHEEQAEHKKNVNGRVALDRLDEQIRSLSTSDYNHSSSSSPSAPTRSISSISKLPPPGSHEEDEKVTWPEFSDGFFVYVGIGLLLLTVINNIAFRVIFGPIDKPVQKVSSAPRVRYRLRSRNEITSLDAPPLVNAP
ncbi:unnamed protein product [Sphagnum troendelagicum]|uniref:Uncharacterized protein n=1 Tax=Sphagnum troendelagicum TaxID=128251 RepID=A0ABP0UPY9_9BRYO